jgi:hypothetical protein
MDLMPKEIKAVQAWLTKNYGACCPGCKGKLSEDSIARGFLMSDLGEGVGHVGIRFPEVLVRCPKCALVLHLDPVTMGLLEDASYGFRRRM